jgi:hypothetical protein
MTPPPTYSQTLKLEGTPIYRAPKFTQIDIEKNRRLYFTTFEIYPIILALGTN